MAYYKKRYNRKKESESPLDMFFDALFMLVVLLGKLLGEVIFQIFKFVFDRRSKIKGIFTLNKEIKIPKTVSGETEDKISEPKIEKTTENIINEKPNYSLKESQITASESNFLTVLQKVIGDEYIIATQVPISSIVSANNSDYAYFNKIKAKTIDYVLFTKERKPYLAIELDDRSHFTWDRRRRDEFVNNLMKEVGLRLLRVRASYSYDENYLKNQISG